MWKQFYRDKNVLIESNYLGKNIVEASTKESHFPLAKALASANYKGEFVRLQDLSKIFESAICQQK